MDESSVLETLGQVGSNEAGEVFRELLRGQVRSVIAEIMSQEVAALCGPAYSIIWALFGHVMLSSVWTVSFVIWP